IVTKKLFGWLADLVKSLIGCHETASDYIITIAIELAISSLGKQCTIARVCACHQHMPLHPFFFHNPVSTL
ncbi:MAG: hypothetical protein ACREOZ_02770, partial [Gloeomargaritales cyanobacterium]